MNKDTIGKQINSKIRNEINKPKKKYNHIDYKNALNLIESFYDENKEDLLKNKEMLLSKRLNIVYRKLNRPESPFKNLLYIIIIPIIISIFFEKFLIEALSTINENVIKFLYENKGNISIILNSAEIDIDVKTNILCLICNLIIASIGIIIGIIILFLLIYLLFYIFQKKIYFYEEKLLEEELDILTKLLEINDNK